MRIDVETKTIGELAREIPDAIALMERWHIDYCCHAHEPIAVACRAAGVTAEELLEAIAGPRPAEDLDWNHQPLGDLVSHIVSTHHAFTRQTMETIFLLSEKVRERHGENHPQIEEVHRLVLDLFAELEPHLLKEERFLFPSIEALGDVPRALPRARTVANSIRVMMLEHASIDTRLDELRRVTDDYALPSDVCLSFRALYERLADLEADLRRHMHLENDVLFARAGDPSRCSG